MISFRICRFLCRAAVATLLLPMAACNNGGGSSPNVFVTERHATFEKAAQTVTEADGVVRITVRLTITSGQTVTVPFAVSGSASRQSDYSVTASPLVFAPGTGARDIVVILNDDDTDEAEETVLLTLGAPTGATLGDYPTYSLRIEDDDAPPTVEFAVANQSVSEAAAGAEIGVQLSVASSMDVSVPFTVGGSATDPDDYSIEPGPFVIPAGSTTASITLTPSDDAIQEAIETVGLTLGAPTNATLGAKISTTVLLQDDDGAPSVGFSVPKQDVSENAGEFRVPLQLFALSGLDVTVPFTVSGTALDPADYTVTASPVTIPAGATSVDIVITLVDDALDEAPETVEVVLGTPTNADLASITTNVTTIVDQDPAPLVAFTVPAQTVDEAGGPQSATVRLSAVSAQEVQVPLVFTGTAEDGADYSVTPNAVVIPAGQVDANISINVLDDTLFEGNETLEIAFGTLVNAMPGTVNRHTVTITDDEATPSVSFTSTAQSSDESAGQVNVEVRLSAAAGLDVTVPFMVVGTASAPADYTIAASPLVIPAGDISTTIPVTLVDDGLAEMNETVRISLGAPVNAVLGANTLHTLTILDNDLAPSVSFATASQGTTEAGGSLAIAVELSFASGLDVSVPFSVRGSASQGPDFSISASPVLIPAGSTSANIALTIADDALDEPLETVEVVLGGRTNASLGAISTHTVSVTDDDPPPIVQFTQSNQALGEGDGAATITVVLSAASGRVVTVPFTLDGAAIQGVDYTLDASPVTFAAGQTSVNLTLSVIDDSLHENNELARLTLGTPTNANLGTTATHGVAIIENDPLPRVEFTGASGSVNETAGSVSIAVQLSAASGLDVIVPFSVGGGSATALEDYGAGTSPLVLPAGAAGAKIVIPILDDSVDESNETFLVTLGTPTNATLGNPVTHTVTIIDEDGAPTVEFTSASQSVPEAAGSVVLGLQLSAVSSLDVTVPFALVDGTAASPADYGPGSSPAVIPAGSTNIAISIPIAGDVSDEPNENFQVTLGTPTNAGLGATSSATVTIQDDDAPPTVAFTVDQQNVAEASGPVVAVVSLSAVSGRNITVPYSLGGTATSGVDYSVGPNPIFIPAGQPSGSVVVTPIDDTLHELDEPARLILQTPQNATIGTIDTHAVVILDNDRAPTVRLAAVSQAVTEGDGSAALRVELSAASGIGVSVPFALGGGSATQGLDYGAATSPVLIPSGQTFVDIVVPIVDDTLDETDESFDATLGAPTNAVLGTPSVTTVTIQDNDSVPSVAFAAASQSVDEGAGSVTLVVALSASSGQDVTVPYTLIDGSTSAADHGPASSPLLIQAGLTSANIVISVTDDALNEADELFSVSLGTPTNASLGVTSVHTVTILDDDAAPVVEFTATNQSASEAVGTVTMNVDLSAPAGVGVTVPYTVTGITATSPDDFDGTGGALVIPAGQTGGLISVTVANDALDEANEGFQVTLGAPTNAGLGASSTHVVTIIDDDLPPLVAFSVGAQSVGEGAGSAQATVHLSAVSGRNVTVPFALVDGTATSPADYQNASSPLVIPAGTTSVVISVPIVDDSTSESDEDFSITLGAPTNATLGAVASQVVTIVDNEGLPTAQLTLSAQSVPEGAGVVTVNASLSGVSSQDVVLPFTVVDGSATSPADHGSGSSPMVIPAGMTAISTNIPINDDSLDEIDEDFTLTLGAPTNASLGATVAQVITILDDDLPPMVQLSAGSQDVAEAAVTALATVQLSAASGLDVTVPYSFTDGTASAGSDYDGTVVPLVIPAGSLSGDIGIGIVDDVDVEGPEMFDLVLGTPGNGTLGALTVQTVTILDDDTSPLTGDDLGLAPKTLSMAIGGSVSLSVPGTGGDAFTWTIEDGRAGAFLDSAGLSSTANPVHFVAGGDTGTYRISVTNLRTNETEWATFELTSLAPTSALTGLAPAPWPPSIADSVVARAADVWGADYAVVESGGGLTLERWSSSTGAFEDAQWKLPPGVEPLPLLGTRASEPGNERLLVAVRDEGGTALLELSPAGVERRIAIGEALDLARAHALEVGDLTGDLFLAGAGAVVRLDSSGVATPLAGVPGAAIRGMALDAEERIYLRVGPPESDETHVFNGLGIEVGVLSTPASATRRRDETR